VLQAALNCSCLYQPTCTVCGIPWAHLAAEIHKKLYLVHVMVSRAGLLLLLLLLLLRCAAGHPIVQHTSLFVMHNGHS
jgi:hypothetical protein